MKENKQFLDSSKQEPLEEELMVFPEELNQDLFEGDHLREEVRDKLIEIGNSFYETFDLQFDVIDMYFEGSMAQYNWVDLKNINGIEGLDYKSDIDLHLVIDFNTIDIPEEVLTDYFISKKQVYNEYHNITIKGFEVELGCENSNTPLASQGVYSLYKDKWIKKPSPVTVEVENIRDTPDYDEFKTYVINTIKEENYSKAKDLWDKIKYMRRKSLELDGEFGKGNLIFKALRQERLLDLLWTFVHNEEDKKLSLNESNNLIFRFSEITNPEQVSQEEMDNLEPEVDDARFVELNDEFQNVRAREEQIEEIKHGKQELNKCRNNLSELCISVEFPNGNDDIGYTAEIVANFFEPTTPFAVEIFDNCYGGFEQTYSYSDIVNIFGVKEELVKEYLKILNKYGEIKKSIQSSIAYSKAIRNERDIIEESSISIDMRYDNIVNPQHLDEDKLNEIEENYYSNEEEDSEYDEDEISELHHELEYNVPARKEQIKLIKNGKPEIEYINFYKPVIVVKFNKTDSYDEIDIGTWAEFRPILNSNNVGKWQVKINSVLGGFDDCPMETNDLIQIFGIDSDLIKRVCLENSDNLRYQIKAEKDSRPDIIEESIVEYPEIYSVVEEVQNKLNIKSAYSDINIGSDEFKKIKEFFANKFGNKIVDYIIKYIRSMWSFDTWFNQTITLTKLCKLCMTVYTMANHTKEELLTSDNFVRIELINSQNWKIGTVLKEAYEDTFNVYEDISDEEAIVFYDVTGRELVEVFNVKNREILGDFVNKSLSRDRKMIRSEEDDNVIEESVIKTDKVNNLLQKLNANNTNLVITEDMYSIIFEELSKEIEPKILEYVKKDLTVNGYRPTLKTFLEEAETIQTIANHDDELYRDTSGTIFVSNDNTSYAIKYISNNNLVIDSMDIDYSPYIFVKNVRDLHDIFNVSLENIEKLINHKSKKDNNKRKVKNSEVIEESYISPEYYKYENINLSDEKINELTNDLKKHYDNKVVDFAYKWAIDYLGSENAVGEIYILTTQIFDSMARHNREYVDELLQEIKLFNNDGGSEQIVGKVSGTFYKQKLNFNLWQGNHAYFDVKVKDLVDIFHISPDNLSKLTNIILKHGDIYKPKEVIEESVDCSELNHLIETIAKNVGIDTRQYIHLESDLFQEILNELKKIYKSEQVDYSAKYIKEYESLHNSKAISLGSLCNYCLVINKIASHNKEKFVKNGRIHLYNGNKLVGMVDKIDQYTFDVYENRTNENTKRGWIDAQAICFFNVSSRDLVDVFNIQNKDLISNLATQREFRHQEYIKNNKNQPDYNDIIEESVSKGHRLPEIIDKLETDLDISKYARVDSTTERGRQVVDYLYKIFDKKYVDFQLNWYNKAFSNTYFFEVYSLTKRIYETEMIANHTKETRNVLHLPCITLNDLYHIYYDPEDESFNIEIRENEFWYGVSAKDLVEVFNIKKEKISWLTNESYNEFNKRIKSWQPTIIEESMHGYMDYINIIQKVMEDLKINSAEFIMKKDSKVLQEVIDKLKEILGDRLVNYFVKYFFEMSDLEEISLIHFVKFCYAGYMVSKHDKEIFKEFKNSRLNVIEMYQNDTPIATITGYNPIENTFSIRTEVLDGMGMSFYDINGNDLVNVFNIKDKETISKFVASIAKNHKQFDPRYSPVADEEIEELDEEFITMKQRNTSYGKVVNSIVKNPTLKELKELANEEEDNTFRVVVSEEKEPDFYFGTANEWIHHEITDMIDLDSLTFYCYDLSTNTFYFNMSVQNREEALEYYIDFYYYFKGNSYLTSTFGDFNLVLFDKDIVGDTPFDSNIGDEGMYVFSKEELDAFENSERNNLDECCSATCAGDVVATVLPLGGIGSKYKAKKGDWKKSAEQINKEIVDNMV